MLQHDFLAMVARDPSPPSEISQVAHLERLSLGPAGGPSGGFERGGLPALHQVGGRLGGVGRANGWSLKWLENCLKGLESIMKKS